ncbi:MAG: hypothetical protein QNI98_07650 [Woeseiaceae bacterium]|nr:hypothetical protein [Woeseiaceae bacterium]
MATTVILGVLTGCAAVQPDSLHEDEFLLVDGSADEDHPQIEEKEKRGKRNMVLTIGAILVLGAIIANEVEDNVEDAVRGAASP